MQKKEPVHIEKKPKKKLAGTLFSSIMAVISLIAGIYLILQERGLYQAEIPKIAIAIILILAGLSSLVQIGKMHTLTRLERMKQKYI